MTELIRRADVRLPSGTDVAALAAEVAGPVLVPGDPDYAGETATYNLLTPLHPAVAVGATSVADVQAAVRFAGRHGLAVAVRGGGHLVAKPTDDAVVVNLRRMSNVAVDVTDRTARIDGATLWGAVLAAATPHGLAPMNGSTGTVGAIGYLLGGGQSPVLGRTYGYAAEHVTEMDVVTADGEFRKVTAQSNPDLFFAIRGSKGNFGIVTGLVTRLFPVARIFGGSMYFAGEPLADLLHGWRKWVADIPQELTSSIAVQRLPPLPELPDPLRGAFVVHVRLAYLGDAATGARLIAPLRDIAPAIVDTVGEMPYADTPTIHSDPPNPIPYVDDTVGLRQMSTDTVDKIVELLGPDSDCRLVNVEIRCLGGALDREPAIPDAVPSRGLPFQLFGFGVGNAEEIAVHGAYLRKIIRALQPWASPNAMVNFLSPHGAGSPEEVRAIYGAERYDRLAAIKATYDPGNMFRINHNIFPAAD